jgi:osmotically-inducible protein OsmY
VAFTLLLTRITRKTRIARIRGLHGDYAEGQAKTHMWTWATRWLIAALIGSAMTTIGCGQAKPVESVRVRQPIVADDSVVHAFDTKLETRLVDRLELDSFLRDRDIRIQVVDGVVGLTGEVWTPLEKERAGDLMRHVTGVIDVANHLDIRPPQ